MSAFKKAWGFLKENDDVPDEDFHQLNDPNPTIAFGAAIRNNPKIAKEVISMNANIAEKKPTSIMTTCIASSFARNDVRRAKIQLAVN